MSSPLILANALGSSAKSRPCVARTSSSGLPNVANSMRSAGRLSSSSANAPIPSAMKAPSLGSLSVLAAAVAGLVGVGSAAGAATLCQKKSGAVIVRSDACKKKETALDLSQFGAVGPKGDKGDKGDQGVAGTPVRASAQVDDGTPPTFVQNSGFTAVARTGTGVYCLTPAAGIDPATSVAVVSVDWYHSSGTNLLAQVSLPSAACAANEFEVRTFLDDGTASDDVAFTIVVP